MRTRPRFLDTVRSTDLRKNRLFITIAAAFVAGLFYVSFIQPGDDGAWLRLPDTISYSSKHPIDNLIQEAQEQHSHVHLKPHRSVSEAAQAYRTRRGRHPPPRFDEWIAFAQERNSPLREEFFDQIYEDLEPFWALNPSVIRRMAKSWNAFISIRDGTATLKNGSMHFQWEWIPLWLGALEHITPYLPDMDMAMNNVDEPRVMVPWEDMNEHMQIALATRHVRKPTLENPMLNDYSSYAEPDLPDPSLYDWTDNDRYWLKARNACHPDTKARYADFDAELLKTNPDFETVKIDPFVKNYTSTRSACDHPYLHKYHGMFILPGTDSTNRKLFPMFSATKIAGISNDILLPPAKYFTGDPNFTGGNERAREFPWEDKKSMAVWRGSPSGGTSSADDWKYFHRQRLVSMMNSSQVRGAENLRYPQLHPSTAEENATWTAATAFNIPLPDPKIYPLVALQTKPTTLGDWTEQIADGGFVHTLCRFGPDCEWMWPYYKHADSIPLPEMFRYKYLPDADGMSYSGRYRSFLDSTSLPIKTTIWIEWHDARLIPWYHFVPMDNTMKDWWGIMEYFAGYNPATVSDSGTGRTMPNKHLFRAPHDAEAKAIAHQGLDWSKKALRNEDMIVYMYRLLLEYARICDTRRDQMGFTADLG